MWRNKFDTVRTDKRGVKWNFRLWDDFVDGKHVAQVFFWNDERDFTGVVLLSAGARTDVCALRSLIQKLVADPNL